MGLNYLNRLPSILAEVEEIESHFHTKERWLGYLAVPAGNRVTVSAGVVEFQADAGNNDWGTAIQILDSSDTPQQAGMAYFDLRRLLITAAERTTPYMIRIAWGASYAAGIAAGNYTEVAYCVLSATGRAAAVDILMPRLLVGTEVWLNVMNEGNTGTLDFLFAVHEYAE